MTRTVVAFYDTREEAELAGTQVVSRLKAKAPRLIGKDTVAAVDDLKISKEDANRYREQLRTGGHLLAVEVASDVSPERIIDVLERAVGATSEDLLEQQPAIDRPDPSLPLRPAHQSARQRSQEPKPWTEGEAASPDALSRRPEPPFVSPLDSASDETTKAARDQSHTPATEQAPATNDRRELRIGSPQLAGGGARVRAFTTEVPTQESVTLRDEAVEIERRSSERRLSEDEVEASGLFKERMFEATEMREEPIVTKIPVLREEVIVRKTIKERTEIVRDTVRRTNVEVEDLPASEAAALFGQQATDQPARTSPARTPEDGSTRLTERDVTRHRDEEGAHSSGWF